MIAPPPTSTLLPYTTLFRSRMATDFQSLTDVARRSFMAFTREVQSGSHTVRRESAMTQPYGVWTTPPAGPPTAPPAGPPAPPLGPPPSTMQPPPPMDPPAPPAPPTPPSPALRGGWARGAVGGALTGAIAAALIGTAW